MKRIFLILLSAFALLFVCTMFSGCEKVTDDEKENIHIENEGNLTLLVTNWRQVAYNDGMTRVLSDISSCSSRLNFVVYQDGGQVTSVTQMQTDNDYGRVSMSLSPGSYKILVLAHSSNGNPTLSNPENIKFTNALGYSDTFYYYGDVTVTADQKTCELTLERATSMLRFIISDELPSDLSYVQLNYTGGSGVFNATTGYSGNVNSRQEKLYQVVGMSSPLTLPVYTFLHSDEGMLNVTVLAMNQDKEVILERSFTGVPMQRDMITEYQGTFFTRSNGFSFLADTEWNGVLSASY